MGRLDGRVAVITGAARGIGREHALLFAAEGAHVVVNDVGGSRQGTGADSSAAAAVVEEIEAAGGRAVANTDDVTDWAGAARLVETALETFGDLHVVVNNAGILRDRMLVNMSEDEWDSVINVHLKGHFCVSRHAAAYWRDRAKAGDIAKRSLINTSSTSGLFGNPGQANYGAAKMGIAALTIIAAKELARYNVRVNAVAPAALTRLTEDLLPEVDSTAAQRLDPANVSPFVGYLAAGDCPINGRAFFVVGGEICLFQPWAIVDRIEKDGRWTIDELGSAAAHFADVPFDLGEPS